MFTKKDLAECAHRELTKRQQNYPRWVREQKMRQDVATKQTDMMAAIYRILIRMDDGMLERLQT